MEAAESLFDITARGPMVNFPQTTMAQARMNWPALKEPLGFLRDHPPHPTTISRIGGGPHERLQP